MSGRKKEFNKGYAIASSLIAPLSSFLKMLYILGIKRWCTETGRQREEMRRHKMEK